MRFTRFVIAMAVATLFGTASDADAQRFLKRFIPVKRVSAESRADYSLKQENGPWLVMACTFSGEGAEQQARELAFEFRERFNIPAFVHAMNFDLSGDTVGRGIDEYGAPKKMAYRRGNQFQEWAVLAGEFTSVDDPAGQKMLKTIKTMRPKALERDADGSTAQSLANARLLQAMSVDRLRGSQQLGPMRSAFMARNPVLPQEYFTPKGVDKFVEKMNRNLPYSLLKNPKKFTVKVATFDGQAVLQGANNAPRNLGSNQDDSALTEAILNAEDLVKEMRRLNIEAYSFHDRNESYVTVGGFDSPTVKNLDGTHGPVPEIARIIQKYGAKFNTPEDPLQNAALPNDVHAEAAVRLASFQQNFSDPGRLAGGLKPKFARIPPNSKNAKVVPFDIYPQVIEVPKKTISGSFAWGRR